MLPLPVDFAVPEGRSLASAGDCPSTISEGGPPLAHLPAFSVATSFPNSPPSHAPASPDSLLPHLRNKICHITQLALDGNWHDGPALDCLHPSIKGQWLTGPLAAYSSGSSWGQPPDAVANFGVRDGPAYGNIKVCCSTMAIFISCRMTGVLGGHIRLWLFQFTLCSNYPSLSLPHWVFAHLQNATPHPRSNGGKARCR